MSFFSKEESVAVFIILAVIIAISLFNFQIALRRGRDNERENDLSDIAKMLDSYKSKASIYPATLSSLPNPPKDPGSNNGYSYLYLSDGNYFQIYASLEGKFDESQYMPIVDKRGLKCGNYICNFGKSSGNTPLDKTIQEYENEIRKNEKK